jgi:cytochrome oxidase Cu insertion factor (SCO1/SenC/PrrC family)
MNLERQGPAPGEPPGVYTIMHGDWFILVDAEGTIRGYYDMDDADRARALLSDARRLAGAK